MPATAAWPGKVLFATIKDEISTELGHSKYTKPPKLGTSGRVGRLMASLTLLVASLRDRQGMHRIARPHLKNGLVLTQGQVASAQCLKTEMDLGEVKIRD